MDEKKSLTPTSATSLLSLILQENKMFPFLVQLVLGGMNKTCLEIYNIDPVGGYTKESKFTSTGSGSLTALGYLESIYDSDMTTQEAVKARGKGAQDSDEAGLCDRRQHQDNHDNKERVQGVHKGGDGEASEVMNQYCFLIFSD